MNKFYRVILSIASICLILGIVIIIVVGITGGWNFVRNGFHYNYNWNWDWHRNNTDYEYESIEKVFDEKIESLDITIPYGNVTIESGDDFSLTANNIIKDSLETAEVKDGVLTIKQRKQDNFEVFGIGIDKMDWENSGPKYIITVPDGFKAGTFNFKAGVGEFDVEDLSTENTHLSLGAGEVEMSNFSADKITIDGGVGSIKMDEVNLNDTNINAGVGEITISGVVTGSNRISNGVGAVTLDIDGNVDDYYIDVNPGVGAIRMNDERIRHSKGDRSADNTLRIDSGVGEVKINID